MTKQEIMNELELIAEISKQTGNILICNKANRIKEALKNEWDLSDFYADLMRKELYYYGKESNL
jgi:hypothetical protein